MSFQLKGSKSIKDFSNFQFIKDNLKTLSEKPEHFVIFFRPPTLFMFITFSTV